MTTKEQELKALQQIRKIVSALGEGSYIAAAFEGCFEIAEQNIENDWACSMKQRAEAAEQKVETLETSRRNWKEQAERWERNFRDAAAQHQEQIERLNKRVLPPDDLDRFRVILSNEECNAEKEEARSAETIVAMADTPTDIAFQNAVRINRNARARKEQLKALRQRIETMLKGA